MDLRALLLALAAFIALTLVECTETEENTLSKRNSENDENVQMAPIDSLTDDADENKRIFRYGRGVFRYGKRAPVFRYGKRGTLFRYGKRADEEDDDEEVYDATKRLFRWGKRDDLDSYKRLFRWGKRSDYNDDVMNDDKRAVFRYGKRSDLEDEEEKRRVFRFGKRGLDWDTLSAADKYSRDTRDPQASAPHVPFRFGDEE